MPDDRRLLGFGEFLQELRVAKRKERKQVADEVERTLQKKHPGAKGWSYTDLCRMENGEKEPNPEVLDALADYYEIDRLSLLEALFFGSYARTALLTESSRRQAGAFWDYVEAGFRLLGCPRDLNAIDEVRALTGFAKNHQILDREGQINWQGSLLKASQKLECFWVATLDPLDHDEFYDVARNNIYAGAMYVYFIRESHTLDGGNFNKYLARLRKDIGTDIVAKRVQVVPFLPKEDYILTLDFVVANPHLGVQAVGFQGILKGKQAYQYNIKMPNSLIIERRDALIRYVGKRKRNRISRDKLFPPSASDSIDLSIE